MFFFPGLWVIGRNAKMFHTLQSFCHQYATFGNRWLNYCLVRTYFQTSVIPLLKLPSHCALSFCSVSRPSSRTFQTAFQRLLCPWGSFKISFRGSSESLLPWVVPPSHLFSMRWAQDPRHYTESSVPVGGEAPGAGRLDGEPSLWWEMRARFSERSLGFIPGQQ